MKRKSEKERRENRKKRCNRWHNAFPLSLSVSHVHTIECADPYIIIAEAIIKWMKVEEEEEKKATGDR
jgi:hypothetical protein